MLLITNFIRFIFYNRMRVKHIFLGFLCLCPMVRIKFTAFYFLLIFGREGNRIIWRLLLLFEKITAI